MPSTVVYTTTPQNVSAQQHLLVTHNPLISYNASNTESFTTKSTLKSTTHFSTSALTSKMTVPSPTPWYPPAGPFDWWQWQWYATKIKKIPLTNHTTLQTTTTIITTNPTTTKSSINLTNTTKIITVTRKNAVTGDWFKYPHLPFTSTTKGRSDYDEEEYNEWPDYFATTAIPPAITTDSLVYFLPGKQRQKFQQMSFLPTKFNEQFYNHLPANPTLSPSKYPTPQYIDEIGERIVAGSPSIRKYSF
jgi:hypothetical protein